MNDVKVQNSAGEQKSYAVAGAVLKCNFGEMKCRLKLPLSHGVYLKSKAQCNIMDFKPVLNIGPFGLCTSLANPAVAAATAAAGGTPQKVPCTPIITMPWMNGKEDELIENFPALLNTSTNMCTWCGVITIEDDGQ